MYYNAENKITGIYISQYNIMFEWNKHKKEEDGLWKKRIVDKIFIEREAESLDLGSLSRSVDPINRHANELNYYKAKIEKYILEHNYADIVKVRIDTFEHSYNIYLIVKNFFVGHEDYEIEKDYLPDNYVIFKKVEKKKDGA
jgi:hypothetical protein